MRVIAGSLSGAIVADLVADSPLRNARMDFLRGTGIYQWYLTV